MNSLKTLGGIHRIPRCSMSSKHFTILILYRMGQAISLHFESKVSELVPGKKTGISSNRGHRLSKSRKTKGSAGGHPILLEFSLKRPQSDAQELRGFHPISSGHFQGVQYGLLLHICHGKTLKAWLNLA